MDQVKEEEQRVDVTKEDDGIEWDGGRWCAVATSVSDCIQVVVVVYYHFVPKGGVVSH